MPYSFRNQLLIAAQNLTSDERSVTLAENVTLTARFSDTGFTNADSLLLEGWGYPSSDSAYEAGRLWRQHLSVAFANVAIAADFDAAPLPQRKESDRPESPEAPGLIVFPQPAGLILTPEIKMIGKVTRPLGLFLSQDLPTVREQITDGLDRRLELAYMTFHRALETTNQELQYIFFVTAIEALIDDDIEKPKSVIDALDALHEYADSESSPFAPDVKDSLRKIFREGSKESIGHLGAELASQLNDTYGGREAASFFKHVYNGRSRILHGALKYTGSRKRPTAREIVETVPELHRFVLHLLTAESTRADTPRGNAVAEPKPLETLQNQRRRRGSKN